MDTFDQESGNENVTVRLIKLIMDMPDDQQQALLKQLEETQLKTDNLGERDISRKPYANTIQFTSKDRAYTGISQDISSSGMFIKTEGKFIAGQILTLTIPFPKQQKQITIPAEIVRITPDGIGVEFMKKIEL